MSLQNKDLGPSGWLHSTFFPYFLDRHCKCVSKWTLILSVTCGPLLLNKYFFPLQKFHFTHVKNIYQPGLSDTGDFCLSFQALLL